MCDKNCVGTMTGYKLYIVQTSYNTSCVHVENLSVLYVKFYNLCTKSHEYVFSQNVQKLISKHVSTTCIDLHVNYSMHKQGQIHLIQLYIN